MIRRIKFSKTKTKFYLDILLITAYVVSMKPMFTGESWHEWLGIALGGAAIIHILLNWKWVVNVTQRFFGKLPWQARINYVLNLLLLISFTLTVASGIIISRNLNTIQVLGIGGTAAQNWKAIHIWIPNVTLIILGIHLALHWNWITHTSKRYLFNWKLQSRRAAYVENKS
jgi:hypothetical protein